MEQEPRGPGYWMHETSGLLRPAVVAYLSGGPMTAEQITLVRAYLRQWIDAPVWQGSSVDLLRATVGNLLTRENIESWLEIAALEWIDPL
jgi:hypothetical protein